MKKVAFALMFLFATTGCRKQPAPKASASPVPTTAPVSGPFSSQELQKFAALGPIDIHAHVYVSAPAFYAMLKKLNLHILDILVDDDTIPEFGNFTRQANEAWAVVHGGDGYVALCTTFNPFTFSRPGCTQNAIKKLNKDLQRSIAVKFHKMSAWK